MLTLRSWRRGNASDATQSNWRETLQGMSTRIRELRKARGFTLQQLADQAGTTAQTIQRLETDNMSVSVDWLQRIAPALGVTPAGLLEADSTRRAVQYLGELDAHSVVRSIPARQKAPTVPIEVPGNAPMAIRVKIRLGPYDAGTLLIADRLADDDRASADGRDCVVKTLDKSLLFRRIVAGPGGQVALVPYAPARVVDRDLKITWIAPILMAVKYY